MLKCVCCIQHTAVSNFPIFYLCNKITFYLEVVISQSSGITSFHHVYPLHNSLEQKCLLHFFCQIDQCLSKQIALALRP